MPVRGQKPKRSYNCDEYRYGFNGKEKDDELKGSGNSYNYGFRIYDSRIARFLSVDPLTGSYPWYTPYQFAGNGPVWAIDLDGLEERVMVAYNHTEIRGTYVVVGNIFSAEEIAQLNKDVNALFNNNPQNQPPMDLDLGLPDLMMNDGSDGPGPAKVTFKIDIVDQSKLTSDFNIVGKDERRILSKIMSDGGPEDIGGLIVMADLNDKSLNWETEYDENGNIVSQRSALHRGGIIYLNPLFYDKNAEGYHGFGPKYDEYGNLKSNWKGTASGTLQHEIGHDLGLTHPKGEYPPLGIMSKGGGNPNQEELNLLTSPDNGELVQPNKSRKNK